MKKNELSVLVEEFESLSNIKDKSERLEATKKIKHRLLKVIVSPTTDQDDKEIYISILQKLSFN